MNDTTGYGARLITTNDLFDNLGYDINKRAGSGYALTENVPTWVYDSVYFTMSSYNSVNIYGINYGTNINGLIAPYNVRTIMATVRPVVTLKKSALE